MRHNSKRKIVDGTAYVPIYITFKGERVKWDGEKIALLMDDRPEGWPSPLEGVSITDDEGNEYKAWAEEYILEALSQIMQGVPSGDYSFTNELWVKVWGKLNKDRLELEVDDWGYFDFTKIKSLDTDMRWHVEDGVKIWK